jgi:ATP-dependent Clp protease adaptor protein ClpS
MSRPDELPGGEVAEQTRSKTQEPPLFRVILHNDDYTTQEFVVEILESVFAKPYEEAYRIMLHVHRRGFGVCGTYAFEIAETKVAIVHDLARERGFPLKASLEEA